MADRALRKTARSKVVDSFKENTIRPSLSIFSFNFVIKDSKIDRSRSLSLEKDREGRSGCGHRRGGKCLVRFAIKVALIVSLMVIVAKKTGFLGRLISCKNRKQCQKHIHKD